MECISQSVNLAHTALCCLNDNVLSKKAPRNLTVFEQLTVIPLIVPESRSFY